MNHKISRDPSRDSSCSVKEMHIDEQPREKLIHHGAESLSNSELLAILLRTGSGKINVVDMSRKLINEFDGLRNLSRRNWQEMKVIPGIARVKAITLEAMFELSRRIQTADLGDQITIKCPEDAAHYFTPKLRDLTNEVFVVAFLNAAKILTGYKKISSGGSTSTIVDTAEVMRQAILNQANSIIVLHNHPSGNKNPSKSDIQLTKRIRESARLLGIPLDDHIIIADNHFTSLRSEGHFS